MIMNKLADGIDIDTLFMDKYLLNVNVNLYTVSQRDLRTSDVDCGEK